MHRLLVWEDLLTLIVDRDSTQVRERERRLLLLDDLLRHASMDPAEFWGLTPARRSRAFLRRYSRAQRAVPELEITSFDVDKAAKERFRSTPGCFYSPVTGTSSPSRIPPRQQPGSSQPGSKAFQTSGPDFLRQALDRRNIVG